MALTAHIITHNDEKYLHDAIQSINFADEIIIVDIGSTDGTIGIIEENKCSRWFKVEECYDRSALRNRIVDNSLHDWQLYIEPWEILSAPLPDLGGDHYYLPIIQGHTATKEIRLWRRSSGLRFENAVYEHIKSSSNNQLNVSIKSHGCPHTYGPLLNIWKGREPAINSPIYYQACENLAAQNYDQFLVLANHYLFLEQAAVQSVVIIKYYCAIVYHLKKDYQQAIQHILECLSVRPLMAEFWCLLGDIHYSLKEYIKAKQFYENAICLGSQRPDDLWLRDSTKYQLYPTKMINSCEQIEKQSFWISVAKV